MIKIKRKKASSLTNYMLPTVNNFFPGRYRSILREIRNAEQLSKTSIDGAKEIVGLDCFHELISTEGELLKVRFRYYADSDQVEELAQVLEHYGYEGVIGDVKDIQENVILSPVSETSKYLYLSAREHMEVT